MSKFAKLIDYNINLIGSNPILSLSCILRDSNSYIQLRRLLFYPIKLRIYIIKD